MNVANLIMVPLPFLNPALHIWKFSVHILLKPVLKVKVKSLSQARHFVTPCHFVTL